MATLSVGRDPLNFPAHKQQVMWTVPDLAERYGITRQGMKDYLIYHYSAIPPTLRVTLHGGSEIFLYDEQAVDRLDKHRANSPQIRMGVQDARDGVPQ